MSNYIVHLDDSARQVTVEDVESIEFGDDYVRFYTLEKELKLVVATNRLIYVAKIPHDLPVTQP